MKYCIDDLKVKGGKLYMTGWAAPDKEGLRLRVQLADASGNIVPIETEYRRRPDVAGLVYGKSEPDLYGFYFSLPYPGGSFSADSVPVLKLEGLNGQQESEETMDVALEQVPGIMETWKRSHGFVGTLKRFIKAPDKKEFLKNERFEELEGEAKKYAIWKEKNRPERAALKAQRDFTVREDPLISFVMPVYKPDLAFLSAQVHSVLSQTCSNFELCIACAENEDVSVKSFLEKKAADSRVRIIKTESNEGISAQTNSAIKEARGSWIAFIDQDDLLEKNLLYEYLRVIRYREADVIYCDEDKLDSETGFFAEPNFKPDYNPDLLTANNYICHMVMVRKSLLDEAGLLDSRFDGAQDHDLLLRLSEVTDRFIHIPKVLYSWRVHSLSTSANPESKSEAYDAGAAAIQAHYERAGVSAQITPMAIKGWYHTSFTLPVHPLVSILIPNRDHAGDLERCIRSLQEVSDYREVEILIIENGSTEEETFELYNELKKDKRVRVLTWNKQFNYSAINNFAAEKAKGEYLLLLNNDTEVISPDFLTSMLGYCTRKDVGAVGARLLYPDGTVQHAGVLVGVSEGADHVFLKYADADPGYMGRSIVPQDMSAVTGACLLTKTELYKKLGGLDEGFTVAYNDVDYCLKLREAGYFVVYDAFAKLTHFESKSRGYEETQEKQERFEQEKKRLREKWKRLSLGDPYYNINLSLKNGYYRLP